MLNNTENTYGSIAKILHWVIGISIIGLLCVGFIMESMPPSPEKYEIYDTHKAFGILVLSLVLVRIVWRIINKTVLADESIPLMLQFAAKIGHFLLYICMLAMPISGALMSLLGGHDINMFGLFTISAFEQNLELAKFFHTTHGLVAWIFVALISTHILAAFYHHFIRKDNTLRKML